MTENELSSDEVAVRTALRNADPERATLHDLVDGDFAIDQLDEQRVERALRSLEARGMAAQTFAGWSYVEGAPEP